MKIKFTLLFLFVACSLLPSYTYAQQLPLTNQSAINRFSLSPAYAGANDRVEIFGSYRNEWMGISGAPETKTVSANGRICKNMGLGGAISSMEAGIFRNISASLSYAYHAKLGNEQFLSFGLNLGLLENHIDASTPAAQADPVAAGNQHINALVLDGGFGILYRCKNFQGGISLPRVFTSKIKNADANIIYSLAMHQLVHMSYAYDVNKDWATNPVLKISMVKNASLFYELLIPITYKQKMWIAPIYKKSAMAVALGGLVYHDIMVQYSFEFASKGIMGQSSGSHEITLGWKINTRKTRDIPNPDSKKPYYQWINK